MLLIFCVKCVIFIIFRITVRVYIEIHVQLSFLFRYFWKLPAVTAPPPQKAARILSTSRRSSPPPSYFLTSASKHPSEAMELDLPLEQVPPLADLAAAAVAALSEPSPSSHAAAAVAALRDAHAAIGSFLSRLDSTAASSGDEQPMMEDGGEEAEQMTDEVKEGLRECALQGSKRRKRPVPPSWPLGRRTSGSCEAAEAAAAPTLDVEGRRRVAMDLLLQFHA
jgi:hypothetical protein